MFYMHPVFCTISKKSFCLVLTPAQHSSLTKGKGRALMKLSRSHTGDPTKEPMGSKNQEKMAAFRLILFFLLVIFLEGS